MRKARGAGPDFMSRSSSPPPPRDPISPPFRLRWRPSWIDLFTLLAALFIAWQSYRGSPDFKPYWAGYWWALVNEVRPFYGPDSGIEWPMTYRSGPLFLFFFLPFAWPVTAVGAALWGFGKVVALRLLLPLVYRFCCPGTSASPWRYAWIPALLCGPALYQEFRSGNMQFYIVALMTTGVCLAVSRPRWAGLCLGMSIGTKIFPAFVLPYLWLRGYRKCVGFTLLFLAIVLWLPAVHFGNAGNVRLHIEWFTQGIGEPSGWEWGINPDHSLLGVLGRYLSRIPYEQQPDVHFENIHIVNLPKQVVKGMWLVLSGALYVGLLVMARAARLREEASGSRPAAGSTAPLELAIVFCAMLIVGPITQRIYLAALLLPAIVAGVEMRRMQPERAEDYAGAGVAWAGLATAIVLLFGPALVPSREIQRWLTVYSPFFWGTLTLGLTLVWMLHLRVSEGRQRPRLAKLEDGLQRRSG
jgi:hypothetical protein